MESGMNDCSFLTIILKRLFYFFSSTMVRGTVSRFGQVLLSVPTSVLACRSIAVGMIGCCIALPKTSDSFSPLPVRLSTTSAANDVILSSTALSLSSLISTTNENNKDERNDNDPDPSSKQFTSPVLQQVYPALVQHTKEYGHPNIPLGSKEGKQCQTLRRLHIQQKLTDYEVETLTALGFVWHSLEDVYRTADFDDLYQRLRHYYQQHGTFDPPKKYAADPELGAWVTGIRRLGPQRLSSAQHYAALNALPEPGFRWVSTRNCGSAFMKQYRDIQSRLVLEEKSNDDDNDEVWKDEAVQKWVQAQQLAAKRGDLTETRKHYMEQLLGAAWTDWKP